MLQRGKLLNLILILSVALNLFFIGGMAMALLIRGDFAPPMPSSLGWILLDLDQDTREELAPQLREFESSNRPLRAQMFRAQRNVNELMVAQPLDDAALALAFEELRQASQTYQQTSHEQTIKVFAGLSDEDRNKAVNFLHKMRSPRSAGSRFPGSRPGFTPGDPSRSPLFRNPQGDL